MNNAYTRLCKRFRRLSRFSHLSAIAGWDMQTMMPAGGSEARGEALAELSLLQHQLLTDKENAGLLQAAADLPLTPDERANLREMTRQWQQASLLPAELVEAKSIAGMRCEHAWRTQRQENDWQGFSQNLREVVRLSRQEADIRATANGTSRYDALLDLYEPGMDCQQLDTVFTDLKQWLPELLTRVAEQQSATPPLTPTGTFPPALQKQLGLQVMQTLGFDFNHGRLDISAHPFCGGIPEDVRITTRYDEQHLLSALMGVIHETGHARYEQNLPKQWAGQPAGLARSTAIHESQSLFMEMQLGRSREFLEFIQPQVEAIFGPQPALEKDNFVALAQQVSPGFIRVDADEVSYPAHVMLRYDIEKALIEGEIEVEDIPALWDEKMQHYLGLDTRGNYREGCMQDIHWTDGAFGYFPTYTLGAMYAAQLFAAAQRQHPNISEDIARGNLQNISGWLNENIWQHGSVLMTDELLTKATGQALNPVFFRQHLEQRYCR